MMKRILFIVIVLSSVLNSQAQEIGFLGGISKLGINQPIAQPLYGFTLGADLHKFFNLEAKFFYSQRMRNSLTQADYITMSLQPKLGYFGKKWGAYFSPALALNPTLDHSNTQNHTYLSTTLGIGVQRKIGQHLIADIQFANDFGMTGGYFNNNAYTRYNGPIFFIGLKMNLGSLRKLVPVPD